MKRLKTGILGGTFNPIHNGHVALAKAVYEYCGLDEVWLMPSGISYMKDKREIATAGHRLEMVKRAISDYPYLKASDMEICRQGNTYTVDTLREVHEKYPERLFYFIMGADSFFSFPKWKEPEEIAKLCTIAVVCREDIDAVSLQAQKVFLEQTYGADIVSVPFARLDISSSMIRECLRRGERAEMFLSQSVASYMEEHKLYREM